MAVGLVPGSAYDQAARGLPTGADPAGCIVILPGWSGRVAHDYAVCRTDRAAAIAVVGRDSDEIVSYQERPVEVVLGVPEEP